MSNKLGAVWDCVIAKLQMRHRMELLGKPTIELRMEKSAE